jgi:hypothetical protein
MTKMSRTEPNANTRTQWFYEIDPVNAGVYESVFPTMGLGYAHWNGAGWGAGWETPAAAERYKFMSQREGYTMLWRGLAINPKK